MMFSTKSEYGVRVMVELARRGGVQPVALTEIAEHERLPLAYLEHLVARLRRAGLIESRRGAHGGYLLAREPGQITMAEVVAALEGEIRFDGENIVELAPHERAKLGLFLAFQYPVAIPGVSVANFLRMAINARREDPIKMKEFAEQLTRAVELLDVDRSFTSRHLNDGFSGGEKKRAEVLQMAMLRPEIAVLDETDSGLDIDALRTVAEGVRKLHEDQGLGCLIITHYQRILDYIKPEFVHVMMDGRIVLEGGNEVVERLEREGYDRIREEVAARA